MLSKVYPLLRNMYIYIYVCIPNDIYIYEYIITSDVLLTNCVQLRFKYMDMNINIL